MISSFFTSSCLFSSLIKALERLLFAVFLNMLFAFPFMATPHKQKQLATETVAKALVLTWDSRGVSEDLGDLRVKVDVQVLLFSDLHVALLYFLTHEIGEGLAHYSVDDVCQKLTTQFIDLGFYWESSHHIWVLPCKQQHALNCQPLEHWDGNELHMLYFNSGFVSAC